MFSISTVTIPPDVYCYCNNALAIKIGVTIIIIIEEYNYEV